MRHLLVFLPQISCCNMGSALSPREKFHVWIYKSHFFTTLISSIFALSVQEPGFSSLISESRQLHQPTLGLLPFLFTGQEQYSLCPPGNTPKYVPGRQTSLAGSALLLAHLAPLFHREEEYSSVLSCRSWPPCMNVYHSRPCLQITTFCSNSSSIYP